MNSRSRTGSRLVDVLALAAIGGAVVGFTVFIAVLPLPTADEWQRLIGATMIAQAGRPATPPTPGERTAAVLGNEARVAIAVCAAR